MYLLLLSGLPISIVLYKEQEKRQSTKNRQQRDAQHIKLAKEIPSIFSITYYNLISTHFVSKRFSLFL